MKKGNVQDRKIRIGGDIIPTIIGKPVKILGKWFRDSLNDRKSIVNGITGRKVNGHY